MPHLEDGARGGDRASRGRTHGPVGRGDLRRSRRAVWALAAGAAGAALVAALVVAKERGPSTPSAAPRHGLGANPCTPAALVRISGDRRGDGCAATLSARVVGSTFGFGALLNFDRTASILDGQVAGYHGPGTYRLEPGGAARSFVEVVERGEVIGQWEPAGGTVRITTRGAGLHIRASELIVSRSGGNATITVDGLTTAAGGATVA